MSKISELSDGGSLVSTDYLIAVRSGGNVKVRMDEINVDQVDLGDNEFIRLGNSQDLTLVHNASNSIINQAGIGNLLLQKAGTTKASITANGLEFPDNSKAIFGAGSDLQIYHDGTHSYVADAGTGSLFLRSGSNIYVQNAGGTANYFKGTDGGAAELFHNGSSVLATTSTGIDVTGTVTADGLTVDGDAVFTTGDAVRLNTSDGADNGVLAITGGGADSDARGARIRLYGNEHASLGGILDIGAGNVSGGHIYSYTNAKLRQKIDYNGDISFYDDTGVSQSFFWDSSAESLGIGTSSPDTLLHLSDTAGGAVIRLERNDTTIANTDVYGEIQFEGQDASAGSAAGIRGKILGVAEGATGEMALAFQTAGGYGSSTERMRIDSSGNLLVGTTDRLVADGTGTGLVLGGQSDLLHASRSGGDCAKFNRVSDDGAIVTFAKDGTPVGQINARSGDLVIGTGTTGLQFYDVGNAIFPLSASGNTNRDAAIDLGETSNRFKDLYLSNQVNVTGSTTFAGYFSTSYDYVAKFESTDSAAFIVLEDNASTADGNRIGVTGDIMEFETAGSEAMRIDSSGNLLVGTTSTTDSAKFSVLSSGTAASFRTTPTTTTSLITFRNGNGLVGSISTNGSATSYNISSDQRLKDNIVDAPSASNDIDAIQVRSFDWKADGSHQKYGMVAQELQSVAPEAVTGDADSDDMMGVDYSKLVPMMLKEIQSLRARVAQLEGEN